MTIEQNNQQLEIRQAKFRETYLTNLFFHEPIIAEMIKRNEAYIKWEQHDGNTLAIKIYKRNKRVGKDTLFFFDNVEKLFNSDLNKTSAARSMKYKDYEL